MIPTLITFGVLAVLAIFVIAVYNGLKRKQIQADGAWSDIDVQLKRRHDLIPNLVNTVKGYASHEKGTLEAVIQARNQAVSAHGVEAQAGAENILTQALGKLFALAEAYPELKANQNFAQLQEELTSTENKIGFARQHYNSSAGQLNEAIAVFPQNVVAGMFSIRAKPFFKVDDPSHRVAPTVQF
jgi:LemA protein